VIDSRANGVEPHRRTFERFQQFADGRDILHSWIEPWTIASLAKEAGVSRSVLAERFRHFLNETPMAYLTRCRLQLGAEMLVSTSYSVAQIASEVGYESKPRLTCI